MTKKLKKDLLKMEFADYKSLLPKKEEVTPVKNQKPVNLGDLRRIQIFPPVYTVLVDELSYYNEKLFKGVILTEEIMLGWLGKTTPILNLKERRTLLIALPFWTYFIEDFLFQYSEKLGQVDPLSLNKILDYAEREKIPETIQGEYIRLVMKRLSKFNIYSLFKFLDKLETYETAPQIIEVSPTIAETLEEYSFQKAAAEKNVFKGKNFLAKVERLKTHARLILYLPQEYIGKKAIVRLKEKTLFEGELQRDKLIIEPLPLLLDYSFLEEELDVQV